VARPRHRLGPRSWRRAGRILLPAPARHLLRDADPRLRADALFHRLSRRRPDRRRRRLRGIPLLPLSFFGASFSLRHPLAFYFFAYALVVFAVAGLKRILDSPFGAVLRAIRENSDRAVACGYDINA